MGFRFRITPCRIARVAAFQVKADCGGLTVCEDGFRLVNSQKGVRRDQAVIEM